MGRAPMGSKDIRAKGRDRQGHGLFDKDGRKRGNGADGSAERGLETVASQKNRRFSRAVKAVFVKAGKAITFERLAEGWKEKEGPCIWHIRVARAGKVR